MSVHYSEIKLNIRSLNYPNSFFYFFIHESKKLYPNSYLNIYSIIDSMDFEDMDFSIFLILGGA